MLDSSYTYGKTDNPSSVVILLHGLGSNGQDLISLAPYLAQNLPDTLFISPDAPFPCDMVPAGYPNSYQWFSLQNRDPAVMLKGIQTAQPILNQYIDDVLETYNVNADKCALLGFSQGTMMSLYCGLRYKEKLAGILGYSGALAWPQDTDAGKLHKLPICLIHGEADDVVPVTAYHMAKKILTEHGFDVSGHTSPNLAHSIDEQGIQAGMAFLGKILQN